jgi:Fe-S-cluster containining protein
MAKYRGKYILEGLAEIPPEMERDLDLAYDICEGYRREFPCELCGRCCHQPQINIQAHEVDRIATAAGIPLHEFIGDCLAQTSDGRLLLRRTAPCMFLGDDNRCTVWADRPEVCDDFPYMSSKLMSRIYLALTDDDADILGLIGYMDDGWPCTRIIRGTVAARVEAARELRAQR